MRPALLLVDLQADFLNAPGLEPAASFVVRQAGRLLEGARAAGVPVFHVVTSIEADGEGRMPHWKALGRSRCVRGTPGHASPEAVAPSGGETTISKTYFSAFSAAELGAALEAIRPDTLFVAGVHLHGCVRATVLDAYQRGLDVWVAEDAVASDDPLHAAVTRRYLEGRAAHFASVEELLVLLTGRDGSTAVSATPLPAAVIDGHATAGDGLVRLTHRSPRLLSETLFTVAVTGAREAEAAAAAAKRAGTLWRRTPSGERARLLGAFADRLEREAPALARELAIDLGKPVTHGEAEVRRTAAIVRRAGTLALPAPESCGPESTSRRVPIGVAAAITPWNNPLAIAWGKIAPALALGNTLVWKPSPPATRVALRSLALARESGVPPEVLQLVTGDHRTAAAVMSEAGVDAVSLSGSSAAGWAAQEICARRRIPLQAELGGNNAAIVWTGADLDRAAALVARGAYSFAGQRCTANRRAIVAASFFDEFLERLTAAAAALPWGDPLDPATEIGPLVSAAALDRIEAAVDALRASGERVLATHDSRSFGPAQDGAYFPPTVIVAPPADSEIVEQETFGPLLVLQRASSFEEALRLANGVRQGLVAALFAGPGPWQEAFRGGAEAGVLKWNAATADADASAPFGGWKASGLGPPERGSGDVQFYSRPQTLYGDPER